MKRILFTLLLGLIGSVCNAQIYSKIMYYDKFDDIIKTENKKTLITQTDSSFIIEEKGREAVEYRIILKHLVYSMGDKDNIRDLTGTNVYGYQDGWCVLRVKDFEEFYDEYDKCLSDQEKHEVVKKYTLFIVHRVISSSSYKFYYDSDCIWIKDDYNNNRLGDGVNRVIYLRD